MEGPAKLLMHLSDLWQGMQQLTSRLSAAVAGLTLPYPQHRFAAEFAIQWLFLLVEPSRLFLGEHDIQLTVQNTQLLAAGSHGQPGACIAQAAVRQCRAAGTRRATIISAAVHKQSILFLPVLQAPRATRQSSRRRCCSASCCRCPWSHSLCTTCSSKPMCECPLAWGQDAGVLT